MLKTAMLTLALATGAVQADEEQSTPRRPIEVFVSPAQLFPQEGRSRARFQPLPAFDRPDGKRIGRVDADLSACPPQPDEPGCGIPYQWYLELNDGMRKDLHTARVAYEQDALLSYQPARRSAGLAWSRIEYEGGAFWVRTEAAAVISYESKATGIAEFDTWCTRPGRCRPVAATMRKEIGRVLAGAFQQQSIAPQTYSIEKIVSHGGRRYYKVKLTQALDGAALPALPRSGYIPTRRKDGSQVGDFSPSGC